MPDRPEGGGGPLESQCSFVDSLACSYHHLTWGANAIMNAQTVWKSGALLTATGMTFGAFGAHSLRSRNLPPRSIESWTTGASYLIYNGLALLAVSYHPGLLSSARRYRWAAGMILGGAVTFSGTVFGLVLAREKVGKVFGPLTPVGGMVMIAGFVVLAL